jgi:hypothetical protein
VEAEFKDGGVKMYWAPNVYRATKVESETYKLLGIVDSK